MSTSPQIIFYGHQDSGHAYKVALALTLADIPFDYQWVDINAPRETRPTAFLAASRWGEVPALVIDGNAYTQSGAILIKLARDFDLLGGRAQLEDASEWILWEANRIGLCIPQLLGDARGNGPLKPDARDWLRERYDIDAARLENALEKTEYLLGQAISIADIAVYGYVSTAADAALPQGDATKAWMKRIEQLEGYQTRNHLLAP